MCVCVCVCVRVREWVGVLFASRMGEGIPSESWLPITQQYKSRQAAQD